MSGTSSRTGTVGGVTRTVSVDVTPTQTIYDAGLRALELPLQDALSCVGATSSGGTVDLDADPRARRLLRAGRLDEASSTLSRSAGTSRSPATRKIGTASSPIPKLAVVGTCIGVTPGTGACNG